MQRMRKFLPALLVCAILAAQIVPSFATILFAGGEDLDFTIVGAATVDTTAGNFRAGYARQDLAISGTTADPPTNRIVSPNFGNQSTVWVHAVLFKTLASTASGAEVACLFGSDAVVRLCIRATGTSGQIKVDTRTSGGVFATLCTGTSGAFPVAATLTKLDWFVNYAVSGHTTVYAGGVSICDFAGDVTTGSITSVNQLYLSSTDTGGTHRFSEVIVSTADTRDMNLFTCAPQANGTNQTWTGTASNVNPVTINDASAINTSSNSQIGEFTCPSLPSGTFTVPAVAQSARTQIGSTGPQNFRFIARPGSGSTDYDSGSDIAGSASFSNGSYIWSTNPAGGSWSTGDLGAGTNFGLKSLP